MCNIFLLSVTMIPSTRSKTKNMLMVNGFTFSQYSPMFWYCTKKKRGCPAKARTDITGCLKYLFEQHNHAPPNYHITEVGKYVKLD